MSSAAVSFEVWNNGRLAAVRYAALAERARTLAGEFSEVADVVAEVAARIHGAAR